MLRYILGIVLTSLLTPSTFAKEAEAIFAGGSFWTMQAVFSRMPGVKSVVAGFDGGKVKFPTYKLVSSGKTDYAEAVKVIYDPDKVSYKTLVNYFFQQIDPTTKDEQFCDKGRQYRTVIFYLDKTQQHIAETTKAQLNKKFPIIYTAITPSTQFYPAEDYHQYYYKKNPFRYDYYRYRCGREDKLAKLWGI